MNINYHFMYKMKDKFPLWYITPIYSYIATLERYQHYRNKQNTFITFQTNINWILKTMIQYELIHLYIFTQKPICIYFWKGIYLIRKISYFQRQFKNLELRGWSYFTFLSSRSIINNTKKKRTDAKCAE